MTNFRLPGFYLTGDVVPENGSLRFRRTTTALGEFNPGREPQRFIRGGFALASLWFADQRHFTPAHLGDGRFQFQALHRKPICVGLKQ